MTPLLPLRYPYTVKRSPHARAVRLTVAEEGLVIVVPQRFCVSRDLPPILEEKKAWIARALEKMLQRAQQRDATRGLPETVELRAVGEIWRVTSAPLARDRMVAKDGTITLTSDFNDSEAIVCLKRWVHLKGREYLPRLLDETARLHRFSYVNVAVKEQKSRWGSCSSKGNVNLNNHLLFLPPPLVRHILIHELCHLKEMNHSKAFHNLLARLDPDAAVNAVELRQAWRFVPGWAL
jgi:predicted metal-dependent hydrolase